MVDKNENFFVTAIIVTHDGATWLPQVIAALSAQTRRVDRLIAVDTGSHDTSIKLLRSAGIPVIEAERDLGYGDAIAIALEQTPTSASDEAEDLEWIWLIHDDCAPARDALELMLAELADRPQVVIAGPKLLGWYDRDHLLEAGVSIAINGARWTGLEPREQDQGQENYTRDVMAVSTAAMLVRRTAFVELGGLDPNLALFRDDVDLGWRAHVAGFGAICVGAATVYHAEASASERRVVDVSEAFLHRPLLLDRRNAAYVLLVNSSWWMLPWVSLQLLGTSLLRALFDLFAKLPGYAGDEIAAIGLLLIHPGELISARRARRKARLLSPGVIKRFIPPRGSQLRAGADRVRTVLTESIISKRFERSEHAESITSPISQSYSDLGTIDDELDVPDLSAPIKVSIIRNYLKRPEFLAFFGVALLSLIASRNRFGTLSGGALAAIPSSGLDLFHAYTASWHLVGMGSATPSPTWMLLLSVASIFTLGNLSLLITILFFAAPPLAFYIFSKTLRRLGISAPFALVGAGIYVLNPLLWNSINQGRFETLLLICILPALLLINPWQRNVAQYSWRRIFSFALFVSLVGALSPLLLAFWFALQLVILGIEIVQSRSLFQTMPLRELLSSSEIEPLARRIALMVTPFFVLLPWSLFALAHPTQWLMAPGLPIDNGGVLTLSLFNSGGSGALPVWLLSPVFLCALYLTQIRALRSTTLLVTTLFGATLILNSLHVTGHGASVRVWSANLLVIAIVFTLPPLLRQAEEIIPTLRNSRLGLPHIAIASATVLLVISSLGMGTWIATSASRSLVQGNQPAVVPAFIGALGSTPSSPKTLVLQVASTETSFYISDGSELSLGQADSASAIPTAITDAMNSLVSGAGLASSQTFGNFGIHYLFVKAPVPLPLASLIDGIGGFARMSSTPSGVMWRVVGADPRLLFIGAKNSAKTIAATGVGATGSIPGPGTLILAENYDHNWSLSVNGKNLKLMRGTSGLPYFVAPEGGQVLLTYNGSLHNSLLSLEFLAIMVAIVMALPSGRRRVQVPLEELV